METIRLKRHADKTGRVTILVPDSLRNRDLDVLVVLQPIDGPILAEEATLDERGWPIGFFEQTYGSLADDPVARLPQLELEVREAIQ